MAPPQGSGVQNGAGEIAVLNQEIATEWGSGIDKRVAQQTERDPVPAVVDYASEREGQRVSFTENHLAPAPSTEMQAR